jgi:predicted DNA-binding transcriptional regulator YafY
MNRIDRLFGILLMLTRTQGKVRKRVRAEDVAARFEVSVRTVYRDMAALAEIGVPVRGAPNEGYQLLDGFFLPPLVFTPDEATALMLSAKRLTVDGAPKLQSDARKAIEKLSAALPELTRDRVREKTEVLQFYEPSTVLDTSKDDVLDFQEAIWQHRCVRLRYYSLAENTTTTRTIEPLSLTYSNGAWYVSGFCRLRQDQRSFRLSRIEGYELLTQTFKPRAIEARPKQPIDVVIRFDPDAIRWVEENQHWGFQKRAADHMHYRVNALSEFKRWLLGWGAAAEPIEPPELRDLIRAEAEALLEILT